MLYLSLSEGNWPPDAYLGRAAFLNSSMLFFNAADMAISYWRWDLIFFNKKRFHQHH
jgi:hypothetical protein